ncbi:PilZ domain-containing protein [Fulvimarina endophytica]|nr:PilZ domain-containing protein [Fulvimarina endophytica]
MRVLKRAKIIFNNGFSTFDCVVRNMSATGALLTLAESAHMPKEFEIKIGDEPARPARLVYRRTMFAGVRYADAPTSEKPKTGTDPSPEARLPAVREVAAVPNGEPALPAEDRGHGAIIKITAKRLPLRVVANLPWKAH